MLKKITALMILSTCLVVMLQGCSFQLRKNTPLAAEFQQLQVIGEPIESGLRKALESAIQESGGQLSAQSKTKIRLINLREDKRIVAYNKERKARIYLISLKFNYDVLFGSKNSKRSFTRQRINLDKTFLYNADFALGKVKEEQQIRDSLYVEAARLILLRLKYGR